MYKMDHNNTTLCVHRKCSVTSTCYPYHTTYLRSQEHSDPNQKNPENRIILGMIENIRMQISVNKNQKLKFNGILLKMSARTRYELIDSITGKKITH